MAGNTQNNVNMGKTAKAVNLEDLDTPDMGVSEFKDGTSDLITSGEALDLEITANVVGLDDRAAALAFMEEQMTIMIAESTDPNAETFVFCAVNGEGANIKEKTAWLRRGVETVTKRKFVERLVRAKPVHIKSVEKVGDNGERMVIYPRTSALRYPFQVVEDQNPRGRDWLRKIMMEG